VTDTKKEAKKEPHHDSMRSVPWLYKLSRLKPAFLSVHIGDEKRTVVVPKSGNKWQKLRNALDPMPWDIIEAFDAKKNYVGRVENPDNEQDDEDDEDDEEDDEDDGDERDVKMAKVMLKLVRETLAEARKMNETVAQRESAATTAMEHAIGALSEAYATALKVSAATAAMSMRNAPSEGADGNGFPPELMQMLMMGMMQPRISTPPQPSTPKPQPPQPKKEGANASG
jgi:hypothetical protein